MTNSSSSKMDDCREFEQLFDRFCSEITKVERMQWLNKTTVEVNKYYYKSGVLKSEIPYKNDQRDGIQKEYYESGAIYWEIPYKNGKKNGIVKEYYESGEIMSEVPYENGKINGIEKGYFRSGKIAYTAKYKAGVLKGYKRCSDGRIGNDDLDCSVQ